MEINININININIKRITQKPGKRGGRPCIEGLRISVCNVLSLLSSGMSYEEILHDFSGLEAENILAVLAFAADRDHRFSRWRFR